MAKVSVDIVGDSRSLERALGRAGHATDGFGSSLKKLAKIAVAAVAIKEVGSAVIGVTKAALNAQASQARLDQAFKNAGLSASKAAGEIDKAEAASRKLGFTDEETKQALGSLITASGSVSASMKDLATAHDLARFKGVGLEDATKMLTMAMTGSQRAAKQLGIVVSPVTSAYDKLKATVGKSIDPTEKLALAHAKLIDKMATGNAVIDAVNAKVKGQAQAFSQTAAGGLQKLNAQWDALKVGLGDKLLPILGKAATGLGDFLGKFNDAPNASAKLQVLKQGATDAFNGLKDAFNKIDWSGIWKSIKQAFDRIDWNALAHEVGQKVIALLNGLTKFIQNVDWGNVGKSIGDGIKRAVAVLGNVDWGQLIVKSMKLLFTLGKALVTLTLSLVSVLGSALLSLLERAAVAAVNGAVALGKKIVKGIGDGLANLAGWVGGKLNALKTTLENLAGRALSWAKGIGEAIVRGIADGIAGLTGWLIGKAGDLVNSVKKRLEFWKSPPDAYGAWIGGLLTTGIASGITAGTGDAVSAAGASIKKIIDAMNKKVADSHSSFATAFSSLTNEALAAFDAASSAMQTKTEKKIASQDSAKANAGRQGDLNDAKWQVAIATTGGDPAAIIAAQQQLADAEFAIQRAADEKKAAAERKALDDKRELQRVHFEEHLTKLQSNLDSQKITVTQFNEQLIALFKANEVPFGKAATKLGSALEYGLMKAFKGVDAAAGALASLIVDRLSRITVKVNVELQDPKAPGQKRAGGGPVSANSPYIVGEKGPEWFIPSQSGTIIPNGGSTGGGGKASFGGTQIVVNVAGFMGTKDDLIAAVRTGLQQVSRSNVGALPGVA